jgi:hypothetical protein
MFFSAASIAGAFSGLLAFGIAKMDGVGGLEGEIYYSRASLRTFRLVFVG